MALQPMADSPWGFMNDWQGVAIWGMIVGLLMLAAIVWGVVAIVKAVASRNRAPADGRNCKSCGMMVRPGNTQCPTCKAQMDWS